MTTQLTSSLSSPKVSVLMPSLNVVKYITECMESVVNQTLTDIEIICIDAGSTDGTLEILREYEKRDPRVHVIVSDKKSYGYQMNLGLDAAHGDYIGIVETDDWAEPNMFEKLWNAANGHDVDVVKSNYYCFYTRPFVFNVPFNNLSGCPCNKIFHPKTFLEPLRSVASIWSAIYRRSFLVQNNIRFNETPGASYQDASFHLMVFTVAQTAYLLSDCLLHYRIDNDGSSVKSSGKVYCMSDEMHYYEGFLKQRPELYDHLIKPFMGIKYQKYFWTYKRIAPQFQWSFLKLMHDEFIEHRQMGLLEEEAFSYYPDAWKNINEIIDHPVSYFRKTCKRFCTHPLGSQLPQTEIVKQGTNPHPDASIIIYALNNEERIVHTLESARKQSLKNIEIICVDDGSHDKTLEMMIEGSREDERMTVLHHVNKGRAASRNAALQMARGRYVQFLDGDDSLREDALEQLVSFADEQELDILYFDGTTTFEQEDLKHKYPSSLTAFEYPNAPKNVLTGKEYFCTAQENSKYRSTVCSALYCLSYLNREKLRFIEGISCEENAFAFISLLRAERVAHRTEQFYHRFLNNALLTTSEHTPMHVYGYLKCFLAIECTLRSMSYDERLDLNTAKLLQDICSDLRAVYNSAPDKSVTRAKFTPMELLLLDKLLLRPKHQLGCFIRWIPDLIKKIRRCFKNNGIIFTLKYIPYKLTEYFPHAFKRD